MNNRKQPQTNDVYEVAYLAGGCFWCMQPPYDTLAGVQSVTVGYMGGTVLNPTYEQVKTGTTGHVEVVRIVFDPTVVSYRALLDIFWKHIDPTTDANQFGDIGTQYRTVVFYCSPQQQRDAEQSRRQIAPGFDQPIVTSIEPASQFYPAEQYHQDFYRKKPDHYNADEAVQRRKRYIHDRGNG